MDRTIELLAREKKEDVKITDLFKAICQDASERVDANLVSIWLLNRDNSKLVCVCAYDGLTNSFTNSFATGTALRHRDYPAYFDALLAEPPIIAPDVFAEPCLAALYASYFKPNKVKSLLDYTLRKGGRPIGVICCENKHEIREWEDRHLLYLNSLMTVCAFHFSYFQENDLLMS